MACSSDDGDGDDSNLEGMLRMIQQKGGDEDEDGGENALVMQDEDENDEAGMQARELSEDFKYLFRLS